jgi:hypothetical protein
MSLFDLAEVSASQPCLENLYFVTHCFPNILDLTSRGHIQVLEAQVGNVPLARGAARTQQSCQVFLCQQRFLLLCLPCKTVDFATP